MPDCRVVELIGHSPGSIELEVETDDGVCTLVGDAIHNARVALSGRSPLEFWNAEQADATIKRVVDSGAIIYPGHDLPCRIRDGEVIYISETEMAVSGKPYAKWVPPPADPPAVEPWIMPDIEEQRLPPGWSAAARSRRLRDALQCQQAQRPVADHTTETAVELTRSEPPALLDEILTRVPCTGSTTRVLCTLLHAPRGIGPPDRLL
jgi:hypothetical protein